MYVKILPIENEIHVVNCIKLKTIYNLALKSKNPKEVNGVFAPDFVPKNTSMNINKLINFIKK